MVDSGASWFFGSDPERGRRMLLALSQAPSAPVRLVLLMREPIQRGVLGLQHGPVAQLFRTRLGTAALTILLSASCRCLAVAVPARLCATG